MKKDELNRALAESFEPFASLPAQPNDRWLGEDGREAKGYRYYRNNFWSPARMWLCHTIDEETGRPIAVEAEPLSFTDAGDGLKFMLQWMTASRFGWDLFLSQKICASGSREYREVDASTLDYPEFQYMIAVSVAKARKVWSE